MNTVWVRVCPSYTLNPLIISTPVLEFSGASSSPFSLLAAADDWYPGGWVAAGREARIMNTNAVYMLPQHCSLQPAAITALQGHFMIYICCSYVARVTIAIVPLCRLKNIKRVLKCYQIADCQDCGIVDMCFRPQPLSTLNIIDHFSSLSIMKLPMY